VLIYGHRGASASEPENTLRAFERAIAMGADGLEFDVQASSDRRLVLIHDRDVSRTTNGTGNVDELTLAELKQLDAGQGERIPTFAETLDAVGDRVHLDIEIKQGGIEREILDELHAHPKARWAISSFDWDVLRIVRELDPDAEIWLLAVNVSEAVLDTAKQLGASGVALYIVSLTEASARLLQDAGLKIVIWTVNDVATAQRCKDLGAAGLCTDAPDVIIAGMH
jgi:glycerophosphoryl diester phosphodiesterase